MDLRLLEGHAIGLFLHVVRAAGFFVTVPLFGRQVDTAIVRLVLALSLGSMFWWVAGKQLPVPGGIAALALMGMREAFVGLVLGFAISLMTHSLVAAGEILANEMGFSMARIVNPESGADSSVVSQLLQVVGFLLILALDLHHEALRVLQQTYLACPVGESLALEPIWAGLHTLVGASITVAVSYAFPVLGVMLLLTVGMVLLGRAVPQINLMEFGYAARVLVALAAAAWFLADGTPFLVSSFQDFLDGARAMFPSR
jgi:flagellar biosynthetic protein FliR